MMTLGAEGVSPCASRLNALASDWFHNSGSRPPASRKVAVGTAKDVLRQRGYANDLRQQIGVLDGMLAEDGARCPRALHPSHAEVADRAIGVLDEWCCDASAVLRFPSEGANVGCGEMMGCPDDDEGLALDMRQDPVDGESERFVMT